MKTEITVEKHTTAVSSNQKLKTMKDVKPWGI